MRSSGVFWLLRIAAVGAVCVLCGCGEAARLTVVEGMGTRPALPQPDPSLLLVIKVAPATGWANGGGPTAADGLDVQPFARDLEHPRWLYVLPNGDVLVAETKAPERPEDRKGVKGAIMGLAMTRAGSATPSANRITLLRDANR
jgi:glucose/arabinose dehydrogenase